MFYVYALIDPRDGNPFYIGKGAGSRLHQHLRDVRLGRRGNNPAKVQRIGDILASGKEPVAQILAEFADEQAALDHEAKLIGMMPGLTNIMAGGGLAVVPAERERRQSARECRVSVKWLKGWLSKTAHWQGYTIPGLKNGDELGEEFGRLVRQMVAH